MTELATHWDTIYQQKTDQQLGWYEADVEQTLRFLAPAKIGQGSQIFIPGAGKTLLIEHLNELGCQLILNDISEAALKSLRETLVQQPKLNQSSAIRYLHHDISQPIPQPPQVDIWIDRAVLHFLLTEQAIAGYFDNLSAMVKRGGYVMLAEFAANGAEKCAGLAVHRYSSAELSERIGSEFSLISQQHYNFINPFGEERPYIYCLFKRN
ncbi:class I SAM-dependent methyltransferase [Colwellia sp. MEBiC06753]